MRLVRSKILRVSDAAESPLKIGGASCSDGYYYYDLGQSRLAVPTEWLRDSGDIWDFLKLVLDRMVGEYEITR